eukprot:TRINITY_DN13390_c0_g1_i1.p1 TRINITY_DN13390_c0_g1~~TRINITY_DN13390_c0_g1_i1.p1  ORF type:complete len:160 (+),score=19.16 TRINITY_DN13390_c0_g1_i1:130-609(+)
MSTNNIICDSCIKLKLVGKDIQTSHQFHTSHNEFPSACRITGCGSVFKNRPARRKHETDKHQKKIKVDKVKEHLRLERKAKTEGSAMEMVGGSQSYNKYDQARILSGYETLESRDQRIIPEDSKKTWGFDAKDVDQILIDNPATNQNDAHRWVRVLRNR